MGETALERVAKARSVDTLAKSMEPVAELMVQLVTDSKAVIEQHQKALEKATAKAAQIVEAQYQRMAQTEDLARSLGWKQFLTGCALGLMLATAGACYAYVVLLNEYRVQAANNKTQAEDMELLWKASSKAQQDEMTARVERFRSRSQPKP